MSGAIGLYTIGEIREDFRAAGLGERQARQLAPASVDTQNRPLMDS